MKTYHVDFFVNGEEYELDVPANKTALNIIRDMLDLTGAKEGCGAGECGACTVIMDGRAVLSCLVLVVECDGRAVTTIEGLAEEDAVVSAFAEQCEPGYGTALQCGYCTPGQIMAAEALLRHQPDPTLEEIRVGMSGNLCRCGAYRHILTAVAAAAIKKKS